ncbi:MAG: hypothetical protein KJP02_11115 [Octadecabacter sp.]|nr:hypothetical protein [Octadecabacter sp.]
MGTDPETLLCDCYKDAETMSAGFVRVLEDNIEEVVAVLRSIEFRRGYLVGHPGARTRLFDAVQPLDVLLVAIGHTLSGRMTSDYLQYAAIYLGYEEDLRALVISDHPAIVPLQSSRRAGAVVIEANGDAVRLIGPAALPPLTRRA